MVTGPVSLSPSLSSLRVLLIDDDADFAEALRGALRRSGMAVAAATSGPEAIRLKGEFRPEIVLVNLDLPDVSGLGLIGWLNQQNDCGVIAVSGCDHDPGRIVALELGADDCVTRAQPPRELVARIRAVNRRATQHTTRPPHQPWGASPGADRPAPPAAHSALIAGPIRIDLRQRQVRAAGDGSHIALTTAEFTVLEALAIERGKPVPRSRLSEVALHRPWRAEDRSVDQLVFSLRQKLPRAADGGWLIESVRTAGYLLRMVDDPAREA